MSDDEVDETRPRRSVLRRYGGAVLLGMVLGIGLLYVLSRFAGSPGKPPPGSAQERKSKDHSKLLALDPELVITESADLPINGGGEFVEPPACTGGGTESVDCLLETVGSKWQVFVATDVPSDGEPPTVQVPVGGRLRWSVVSEQRGLLTSFLVEEDGGVLLIYPSPVGEMPVIEKGTRQGVPRQADRANMKWSRPGPRRVFALVSTTPIVAPEGITAGRVATYYAPGEAAESFFAALRNQIHQDQVTGVGEWAVGEARFEVRARESSS